MNDAATLDCLNRLLATLYRSLPQYLHEADPWTRYGQQQAAERLAQIIADQQRDCGRLAELILDRGGQLETGEFPMEFTDLHFLSLDFLLKELVRHQRQDIARIQRCVDQLKHDSQARELGEEILGSERAHLETLEELDAAAIGPAVV
jgi:hypothetical protein